MTDTHAPSTVGAVADSAIGRLKRAGVPMPRIEAMRLLAWVLGTDRGGVVARRPDALPAAVGSRFEALLRRRERREPLQYLTGEQEFLGLVFAVDRRVLVPRPETEQLVEAVLELPVGGAARVLDVGTGSGCIAVTLASRRPGWEVSAVDVSPGALDVARENAARHGVASRVRWVQADLGELPDEWGASRDVVVSNPPYVSAEEWRGLAPEVREHEPRAALVPGPNGHEAYRRLAPSAFRVLRPGGILALELGHRSEAAAREAVAGSGFIDTQVCPDLRGIPRVLMARRP